MNKYLFSLLFFVSYSISFSASAGKQKNYIQVGTSFREAQEFLRIPEFFTQQEYTGKRLILRSDKNRSGLYFEFFNTKEIGDSTPSSAFILQVIDSSQLKPKKFVFDIPNNIKEKTEVILGLTGPEWNTEETRLIAWKLSLVEPEQDPITLSQSALWEH